MSVIQSLLSGLTGADRERTIQLIETELRADQEAAAAGGPTKRRVDRGSLIRRRATRGNPPADSQA